MRFILFDSQNKRLLPLSFTRPVYDFLIGIWTIREKWEKMLGAKLICVNRNDIHNTEINGKEEVVFLSGDVYPTQGFVSAIDKLNPNEMLISDNNWIAVRANWGEIIKNVGKLNDNQYFKTISFKEKILKIDNLWNIFLVSDAAIRDDFSMLREQKKSQILPKDTTIIGDDIFIEEGAEISAATINTKTGPVYIGKDATIMEGALIRGPFSLGKHSTVKMGAKIYGATSIGKHCKVGGEISNCTIFDYSNKGHDGFIGNSVIGSWCNLGADTNTSNLKNNYSKVRFWNYEKREMVDTGQQFLGTIMGDYSKTSINTMLNTGSSVGVCSNILGAEFPEKFVPSFAWYRNRRYVEYNLEKAYPAIDVMMQRRNKILTEKDKEQLKKIFEATAIDRKSDKKA